MTALPDAPTATVRAARCTSCGAVVEVPAAVLSTTCRFCDSPMVEEPSPGERVDGVVPFVIPKQRASERLREELQGRWFAPARLRTAEPDDLRPAFVPCWAWDASTQSRWTADVGVEWQRTETYTTTENGKTVTKTRTVTEVEWFDLEGEHVAAHVDHLVSGSRGLAEAEANALEPFDLGRAEPWDPARVAGVVAERPTVDRDAAAATARSELAAAAEAGVSDFLPGDQQGSVQVRTDVDLTAVRLVLVPVWIALVGRGDDAVRLLVNGQTGEIVGDTPLDPGRVIAAVIGVLVVIAALVLLLARLGGGG